MTLKSNFLRNKIHRHSAFTETSLISTRQEITEIFQFKYIDDVIVRQPEVPLSTTTRENLKRLGQELTDL